MHGYGIGDELRVMGGYVFRVSPDGSQWLRTGAGVELLDPDSARDLERLVARVEVLGRQLTSGESIEIW